MSDDIKLIQGHYCWDWDGDWIEPMDLEWECCNCNKDIKGETDERL